MPDIFALEKGQNSALFHAFRGPAALRTGKKSYLHPRIRGAEVRRTSRIGLGIRWPPSSAQRFWPLRSDLPPEFSHGRRNNSIVIGADDRYGVAHFFGQVVRVSKDSGPIRAVRMA